jgi:hypothetical protein
MSVALTAVADDRDLTAFNQFDIAIFIVKNFQLSLQKSRMKKLQIVVKAKAQGWD